MAGLLITLAAEKASLVVLLGTLLSKIVENPGMQLCKESSNKDSRLDSSRPNPKYLKSVSRTEWISHSYRLLKDLVYCPALLRPMQLREEMQATDAGFGIEAEKV